MFKTHNHLTPRDVNNSRGISPENWGGFRKSYLYGERGESLEEPNSVLRNTSALTNSQEQTNQGKIISKTWIYVGIAIVYVVVIGIVVAVLLLAPKYPSFYDLQPIPAIHLSSNNNYKDVLVPIDHGIPNYEDYSTSNHHSNPGHGISSHQSEKKFVPSPKDDVIVFDINPRKIPEPELDETVNDAFDDRDRNHLRPKIPDRI